jgi:hypothetical protein
MGCDGGTIPKRDELVRTKKKQAETSKDTKIAAKWNNCHLSQLPLQKPIVADQLGFLYNKESFIEFLLDKSKYESGPDYIKSLKDVKELSLVDNPSFAVSNSDDSNVINKSKWICPISGLEMNGSFKFYFLFSCGCVFSERAYKQISQTHLKCLKCDKDFIENDLIIINANEDELLLNKKKMVTRKELKSKSKANKNGSISSSCTLASSSSSVNEKESLKDSKDSHLQNGSKKTIETTSKDKRKQDNVPEDGKTKKVKTIQDDPTVSDVYKSLFNTHEKAQNQTKAHWVTFNPQYF